jgi:hypothetical protein
MSEPHSADADRVSQSSSRRRLLQRLAIGSASVFPLLSLGEAVDAGKGQRRQRRRKKRKKNPPPVQPAPDIRADATCPAPATTGSIVASGVRVGQSFTAGFTADLVRAELVMSHFDNNEDGEYFLRLAPLLDGLPADVALATARVDDRTLPDGESVVVFTFNQAARVTAGVSYALILARAGGGQYGWSGVRGGCPGRAFVASSPTGPFEPRDDTDFLFTTFVRV